jgi:hypothetical protein
MVDANSLPSPEDQASTGVAPRLMAVVEVDKSERVYCAQPGCHHTVYKAIHVVKDGGKLLVLGSTCFQKRFGSPTALGKALHWGGNGKVLTSEERALLAENTQALLSRFEAEEARLREEAEQKLMRLREEMARRSAPKQVPAVAPFQIPGMRGMSLRGVFPWPWMMPSSSVAAFKLRDGSGWVRVQHKDRKHFIVPWPSFEGWDEAMPPVVGRPNLDVGGYEVVGPVVDTISYLRAQAAGEKITGVWNEVTALLGSASRRL